jgi:hypothetical protein
MARWLLGVLLFLLPSTPSSGQARNAFDAAPPRLVEAAPVSRASSVDVATSRASAGALTRANVKPLRVPLSHALLVAPRGCEGISDEFDVLIHFHGAFSTVEPILMKSGIDAVYVVVNLGIGSGAYEDAFASPKSLDAYLALVASEVNRRCRGTTRSVGRVALSGWSAGYGAIYRVLARPAEAARVDAVLLADGMHVGFENGRRVRAAAMAPFQSFAASAARGEKLMAVTHSAIVPPTYASTTATAHFLPDSLGLQRRPLRAEGLAPGMEQLEHAEQGSFVVDGYAGGDAPAHCAHLYAIGDTLWSRLLERWSPRIN